MKFQIKDCKSVRAHRLFILGVERESRDWSWFGDSGSAPYYYWTRGNSVTFHFGFWSLTFSHTERIFEEGKDFISLEHRDSCLHPRNIGSFATLNWLVQNYLDFGDTKSPERKSSSPV